MKVAGSVALVTGANRGIGFAFIPELLKRGAKKVYAAARNPADLAEAVALDPARVVPVTLDVTKPEQCEAAAIACADLTLLINNAGISHYGTTVLEDAALDYLREELEVNVFGIMHTSRAFHPVLRLNGGGCIVNILSGSALQANALVGTYSATKAAALSLTKTWRCMLRDQKTLVIAAIVGSIETRLSATVPSGVPKSKPEVVAVNTLDAVERNEEDVDTDPGAIATRARVARDPKVSERWHDWRLVGKKPAAV